MINKNLRDKSSAELKLLAVQLKHQLMKYRFEAAEGKMLKGHLFKEVRRSVAQILTILHQRNETITSQEWAQLNKQLMVEKVQKAASRTESAPQPKEEKGVSHE